MASWFDSSSLTGFLSQAQKSIDKVLDIPNEGKSDEHTRTETKLSRDLSQDNQNDTNVSNSSWLSGEDSFWGSFVKQTSKVEDKKKEIPEEGDKRKELLKQEDNKEQQKKTEGRKKEKSRSELLKKPLSEDKKEDTKKNELREKEITKTRSELSKKSLQSSHRSEKNRVNGKRDLKKLVKPASSSQKEINELESGKEILQNNEVKEHLTNDEILSLKEESKVEEDSIEMKSDVGKRKSIEDYLNTASDISDGIVRDIRVPHKTLGGNDGPVKDTCDNGGLLVGSVVDEEHNVEQFTSVVLYDSVLPTEYNPSFEKQVLDADKGIKNKNLTVEVDLNAVSQEEGIFYSTPVASSTPCIVRAKQVSLSDEDDSKLLEISNHQDCVKSLEKEDFVKSLEKEETSGVLSTEFVKKDTQTTRETNSDNVSYDIIEEDSFKKENVRLSQVIEVRESKLVSLSKENLDLQETNAILRSQLEQLELIHKTEDTEFNEMKEEFTNRISNAESKLKAAAKERDLYKQQLEETQQCLSSDIERQLKEFQLLSQQKDQQIVELMEEGQKLSKEVLQRSNNIKKLRSNEKEMSEENEKQKTRLVEAESEIERLTKILKERDEHKKEQDDAIKKLNAYIQKQDEQLAKQKVELEESSAKLPSLQTALDNAYKEISELHKMNAAKSNAVQEATLSVEMTAKEQLRISMAKLKKESQKDCDVLALEVTDLQIQLSRGEQQAARREDNLRQEIADVHMRLQEAETRNQELSQTVSVATRPLLRQIENLQHSYGSQQASWEKLEKNLTERLADTQDQQATSQEKERAATEKYMDLSSKIATLESQVGNYRHEKSRLEAELEIEKTKLDTLEDYESRETGKIEALKTMHSKQLENMLVEKSLLEQQLEVERTTFESEKKKYSKLNDQLREQSKKQDIILSKNNYENEDDVFTQGGLVRSRNTSVSSQISLSDNINRGIPSNGSTAILEDLRATIRHKEGELSSMQSAMSTLEVGRESLTKELTTLVLTNENLLQENINLSRLGQSFQDLQTKYNALLQMYGEKQEETEELKLDLQDIKMMYKAQIQELVTGR